MASLNKVMILGNLGSDPEVRYTSSGKAVANLSVATTETWTDKQTNQKHEETEWHRCVLWGRLAEVAGEYLKKSSKVYLEGKNKTEKFTDNNNIERYVTKVVCDTMIMLDGKKERDAPQQENRRSPSSSRTPAPAQEPNQFDDPDIPF